MNRAIVFLLAIAATALALEESSNPALQQLHAEIIENGGANPFFGPRSKTPPTSLSRVEVNATIVYSVGARTEDDRLAGSYIGGDYWGFPKSAVLSLKYPIEGQELNITRITYAEATVHQSSPLGYAYVIGGGPGQNHIAVVLGALETSYLGVDAKIYGV